MILNIYIYLYLYLYTPKVRVPNIIKQTLLNIKGQITWDAVIVGDFNTSFSSTDRSSTHKKKNKGISELNNIIDKMDLTEIYPVQQQIPHSSQQPMELSPKQITS
jgi:hypothetical protein